MYDTIIIGAGPAGMTAAIYLRRAGHSVLILESAVYGGQMANTPEVENYPSIAKISGFELSTNLYEQVKALGAVVEFDGAASVNLEGTVKTVTTLSGKTYEAKTVIIANGAQRRKLEIPGEETFSGKGVSYCATCDGGFFRKKTAVVVGGGNTALEDALYLDNLCEKVYLVHRRNEFRASKILVDALSKSKIEQVLDSVPEEIFGSETAGNTVGSLRVRNVKTGEGRTIPTDAVFVAVGLVPDNQIFAGQVTLDNAGYVVAGEDTKTNLPGVFVAGDTRTKALRQIVTAAGDGAVAASMAGQFLMEQA